MSNGKKALIIVMKKSGNQASYIIILTAIPKGLITLNFSNDCSIKSWFLDSENVKVRRVTSTVFCLKGVMKDARYSNVLLYQLNWELRLFAGVET